ncbi:hypothetical protein A0H81_12457 [Grifola frondosa]|uniref:Uncharacterized protein n=1 Tax=Grifola frondosa TaxID=5627 RepID=A0A1C7LT07_GRIFR|nr:hypothetical protein A0H81_12457 [Grifola frondosa]
MSTSHEKTNSYDEKIETVQPVVPVEPSKKRDGCLKLRYCRLGPNKFRECSAAGVPQDALHGDPTGVLFDWVNSLFFFSYIICQVPAYDPLEVISSSYLVGMCRNRLGYLLYGDVFCIQFCWLVRRPDWSRGL